MNANFVSLHNHTEYSFLDGAIRVKDLVKTAGDFDMPAVAITDHGGLFGAVEFFSLCKYGDDKEGIKPIKPIIGFEAYVAPASRLDKKPGAAGERNNNHLVLLAENNAGWKNLMKLSSIGYCEGFYSKPRIDMEVLRKHSEGIIATSACVAGAIPQAIIDGDMDKARKIAEEYISIFGADNFFFELQDHGLDDEKKAMPGLIKLGREMGVPFIVANDAHYLRREDAPSHEILLCIGTQSKLSDPKRYRFSSEEVYFKSPEEMAKLFPDIPEAMENTVKIAERCNVDITKNATLPSIDVPKDFSTPDDDLVKRARENFKKMHAKKLTADGELPADLAEQFTSDMANGEGAYLAHLAREGLKKKYADITPELIERLEYELGVIVGMGFASYFLIVRDFVRKAADMGIMVGCRGSAAGCLVFYAIGVTDVDPIKFDLIFERFLNPERVSMPDADIDFADRDRQKVIDYVIEKYGRDAVCQIINFGSMKAKNAVKDVARVLEVPVSEANELTKLIPDKIPGVKAVTLPEARKASSELAEKINNNNLYGDVFKHAEALEGLKRQPGMHAGGVIIAPSATVDWAPLFRTIDKDTNTEVIMTQFDMNYVEKVGLVKMDFLGLRTLSVLQESLRLIKKYHDRDIELWKLPDDDLTYALFGEGETTGVFQFESGGMKGYLRKLKPTCIEDVIAMVALYRPGPMDNIDSFIDRKYGREKIKYPHPMLENILKVTYGVIIYQEQVMRIAQVMGGFSLGMADVLRKAMGKKQAKTMEKMGVEFVSGAAAQGISEKTAKEVYDLMAKFAEYGFNKSHAAVYAHLSYQTAYLKAHYPVEYITAYLGAYIDDQGEFVKMRDEAERMGIHMLPPDVNTSEYEFSIEGNCIRIGFGAVKNVGKAGEEIIRARVELGRPFTSIFDVCKNTDNRLVNKKALESLICAGAFDCFEGTRAQHFEAIPMALEYGVSCHDEQASGQVNLFDSMLADGGAALVAPEPTLPQAVPWPLGEQLKKEKDILGFYASGHPLDFYADEVKAFSDFDIADENFKTTPDGTTAVICGIITASETKTYTQKKDGRMRIMGRMTLESFGASIKALAFGDEYDKCKDLLTADSMVLAYGKIRNREGNNPELHVESCFHLSQARLSMAKSVHINIAPDKIDEGRISEIRDCCAASGGDCNLIIHLTAADGRRYKIKSKSVSASPSRDTLKKLRDILGKDNVWISKKTT